MNSHILSQIAAATAQADKLFYEDSVPVELDSSKVALGREIEVKFSQSNDVVTAQVVSKRAPEGPKLAQAKQAGSPVHAPAGPQPWGKPSGR